MFAPIEPGLRDGMENKTATVIRYNSCTRIMTITFEAQDDHGFTLRQGIPVAMAIGQKLCFCPMLIPRNP
tara:strand:- start:249 stop:458 length:210 start_codon:yes stop_codon:yes gene_type:complete